MLDSDECGNLSEAFATCDCCERLFWWDELVTGDDGETWICPGELGTARGFAKQDVDRAKRELARAEAEYAARDLAYQRYLTQKVCACGEWITPDMPYIEVEADGVMWHGNAEGGGHRADVKLP